MSYRGDLDALAARIEALAADNRRLRDEVAARQRAADLVGFGHSAPDAPRGTINFKNCH